MCDPISLGTAWQLECKCDWKMEELGWERGRERSHEGKIQSQTEPYQMVLIQILFDMFILLLCGWHKHTHAINTQRAIEREGERSKDLTKMQRKRWKMSIRWNSLCVTKKPNCIRKSQFQTKNLYRNAEQSKAQSVIESEWAREKSYAWHFKL